MEQDTCGKYESFRRGNASAECVMSSTTREVLKRIQFKCQNKVVLVQ